MSSCQDIKTQRESAEWPRVRKSTDPKGQEDKEKKNP